MFVFKVNNQLKGANTCLLRKYVFIVNFPIFTTCSLLYVASIAADNHVKLIIAGCANCTHCHRTPNALILRAFATHKTGILHIATTVLIKKNKCAPK